jgi:hypothetical protein
MVCVAPGEAGGSPTALLAECATDPATLERVVAALRGQLDSALLPVVPLGDPLGRPGA